MSIWAFQGCQIQGWSAFRTPGPSTQKLNKLGHGLRSADSLDMQLVTAIICSLTACTGCMSSFNRNAVAFIPTPPHKPADGRVGLKPERPDKPPELGAKKLLQPQQCGNTMGFWCSELREVIEVAWQRARKKAPFVLLFTADGANLCPGGLLAVSAGGVLAASWCWSLGFHCLGISAGIIWDF